MARPCKGVLLGPLRFDKKGMMNKLIEAVGPSLDIDFRSEVTHFSAAHLAVCCGSLRCLMELVERWGAVTTNAGMHSFGLLHEAAYRGNMPIVLYLMKHRFGSSA